MEVKLPGDTLTMDEGLSTAIFPIAQYGCLKRYCGVHPNLMSAAGQWLEGNPGGLTAHLVKHPVVGQRPFTFFGVWRHPLAVFTGRLG